MTSVPNFLMRKILIVKLSILRTQETNIIVTKETPEVDNEHVPLDLEEEEEVEETPMTKTEARTRTAARTATRPHRPIDVIAVAPSTDANPDAPETAVSSANRVRPAFYIAK